MVPQPRMLDMQALFCYALTIVPLQAYLSDDSDPCENSVDLVGGLEAALAYFDTYFVVWVVVVLLEAPPDLVVEGQLDQVVEGPPDQEVGDLQVVVAHLYWLVVLF